MATNSNWCLLTGYNQGYASIAAMAVPAMRRYAERFGLDFHEEKNASDPRGPAWSKMALVMEQLDRGYEFVFWVDADAVFSRFDVDIRTEIEAGKDLYFANEPAIPAPEGLPGRLNAGVFIVRNTAIARRLLEEVNQTPDRPEWSFQDQSAFHQVLGFESMHAGNFTKPDLINLSYVERLHWLPAIWNCDVGANFVKGTVVRHFMGGTRDSKYRLMQFVARLDQQMLLVNLGDDEREALVHHAMVALTDIYEAALQVVQKDKSLLLLQTNSRSWLTRQLGRVLSRKMLGRSER